MLKVLQGVLKHGRRSLLELLQQLHRASIAARRKRPQPACRKCSDGSKQIPQLISGSWIEAAMGAFGQARDLLEDLSRGWVDALLK
jgi:hypothetical protein